MNARVALFVSWSILAGCALSARAQAFRGLGTLNPSDPTAWSQAFDVSADGSTVVGVSASQAFRWRASAPAQLEALGFLPTGTTSSASGVSADGSVVAGKCETTGGLQVACRWVSNMPPVSLGTLPGADTSEGEDCSADGSVVVGFSFGPFFASRGFRWTQATGMVELQSLPVPGKSAEVYGVSGDGLVAVGRSGCCDANQGAVEAVRYPGGGVVAEGLGDLQITPAPWSSADGASADGSVVVGAGTSGSGPYYASFRWTAGGMTELTPPLPTGDLNSATAVSADGSTVVGAISSGFGGGVETGIGPIPHAEAFIWTELLTITDLQGVLVNLGLGPAMFGWDLKIATGISADGNIITGYGTHNGRIEGWVAALSGTPFPSDEPPPPPDTGDYYWGSWVFGVSEHHGYLWHPSSGPVPILPDPPPEILAAAGDGGARWVEGALAPRAVEQQWAMLSSSRTGETDFRVVRFDGRAWSLGFVSRASGLTSRAFDLIYENHSGEALAVYENGMGTLRYRTYSRGVWSDERALPRESAPREVASMREGPARWIELAGRPGSDEIALVYVDDGGNLQAWTWDGSCWLSDAAVLLATDVKLDAASGLVQPRPFDADYESLTGALHVAWASRGKHGFTHARRDPRQRRWSKATREPSLGASVEFVDLAAEPASNLVAGIFVGREAQVLSMWSGDRWNSMIRREKTSPVVREALAGMPGAVAWSATSRTALAVYRGDVESTLDWSRWSSETGWAAQRSMIVPQKGLTRSMRMIGSSDGGPFLLLSDSRASLFAFHYDGRTWQRISDAPSVRELASPETVPFALSLSEQVVLFAGESGGCRNTDELLSFALVPAGRPNRVDQLSFTLENAAGVAQSDWSDIALVVDANANGTIDAGETTSVGGPGYPDSIGNLVFFRSFDVATPTHYVLRASFPIDKKARVNGSLDAERIVSPRGFVGGAAHPCD